MTTKGFKVFDPDWKCRNYQYEVGETYKHEGRIELCGSGFHYCNKLADCFNYYSFDRNNKVAEIEAVGEVESGDDKSVTNEIKIVKEITWNEVLEMVNTGKGNTGMNNSGNGNSGYENSGNRNPGNRNSGDGNSGYGNSGNRNSGNRNSGYGNSGMFNSCDHANGLFNSQAPKIYMFNKPTKLTYEAFKEKYAEAYSLLKYSDFYLTEFIPSNRMTDEEKAAHPQYETTEGYLKVNDYKTACQKMWDKFSDKQKKAIKKLPNFDKAVFKEITGIEV